MVETVLAVLFVSLLFAGLFWLSQLLTAKILVQHAAMRVARARAIGMNDFMCLKAARLAVLPAAGRRIRPTDEGFTVEMERARFENYLVARTPSIARAVLDYEGWSRLSVEAEEADPSRVTFEADNFLDTFGCDSTVEVRGEAGIEENYTFYLNDQGR